MGIIIYSFNLNISPQMPYGVLDCDIMLTKLCSYDFLIKYIAIKRVLFVPDYIYSLEYIYMCMCVCVCV